MDKEKFTKKQLNRMLGTTNKSEKFKDKKQLQPYNRKKQKINISNNQEESKWKI